VSKEISPRLTNEEKRKIPPKKICQVYLVKEIDNAKNNIDNIRKNKELYDLYFSQNISSPFILRKKKYDIKNEKLEIIEVT